MKIESSNDINNKIKEYQLKQYTILEKIQIELLDNNKFLNDNKPYLNKLFLNEITNYTTFINEYGYLISFTNENNTITDKSCPDEKLRQGYELYAYSHEGSTIDEKPLCNIYGKNIKDSKTNDIAWVDIEGYKHEYTHNSWNNRDMSCKEPVVTITHKQYSNIPKSQYSMTKERQCMKTTVNPALIYELQSLNKEFIDFLKRIKGDYETNNKLSHMIKLIEKQNLSIVHIMNKDQSIDSMLKDSVVKKDMYEYQYIAWTLVTILGIGLIGHFSKKKL
tara:strand:- start:16785 stop:17615 length:831 start_codon:yes stop_codon:yes gene_type:complete